MRQRLGDRRGRPRFEIVGELWGTLDTVIAMPLRNIGRGGALVESAVSLPALAVHHVAVNCEGEQTSASVRVRHVQSTIGVDGRDRYLIGFEFLSMPAPLLAQIDRWFAAARS
jgi:hypothetical protein